MIGFISEHKPCKGYRFALGAVQSIKATPWFSEYGDAHRYLFKIVPQLYGEAIQVYPDLKCEPHEWDNRTTVENFEYLYFNGFIKSADEDKN